MTAVHEHASDTAVQPDAAEGAKRSGRSMRVWSSAFAAIGVPTALVGLHALLYGRWIVDDAAITFAYARSITSGAGPVLQTGAPAVEGYSNPAWMAILMIGRAAGLFDRGTWFGVPDYVTFPKLVALLCCAGMFAVFYAAARAVSSRPALVTIVAGSVTAAVPSFVIWCFSGLENALLGLAAVAIGTLLVRAAATEQFTVSTGVRCGLLAALAALTRPDGLVYAAAFPIVALLFLQRDRVAAAFRSSLMSIAAFTVPLGAYLAWRLLTFGEYLPNTALAKSQGIPGPADLARPGELLGYAGWLTVLVGGVLVGAAVARPSRLRNGLIALLVPLGLALTAYAVLEPDWMGQHRFATPVWPLGALAATLAAARVVPRLAGRGRASLAVIAAVAATLSGLTFADSVRTFRQAPTAPLCLVAENTGHTFDGYAQILGLQGGTLLAPDIGGAALTSDLLIVDLAGLADARIAEFWRMGDMAGLRDYVFDAVQPTFIISHSGWSTLTGLVDDTRMSRDYEFLTRNSGGGNWVRRDVVPSTSRLAMAREFAVQVAAPQDARYRQAPRSSCGDTLRA